MPAYSEMQSVNNKGAGIRTPLLCLFFLSGVFGLVYEMIWMRQLGLIFGNTTYAVSVATAAFMAGLALGAWYFGRRVPAFSDQLRVYALLELALGLYALLSPLMFMGLETACVAVFSGSGAQGAAGGLLKFLPGFAIVAAPAALMGGTFPVLSAVLGGRQTSAGPVFGLLYSVNTFGAVIGTLAAGFLLLSALGTRNTLLATGLLNLALSAAALGLSRKWSPGVAAAAAMRVEPESPAAPLRKVAVLAAMISGFVSLSSEVIWTRMLSTVIGSSVYAFTVTVAAFLCGIAAGSAIYHAFGARLAGSGLKDRRGLLVLGVLQGTVTLALLLLIPAFTFAPLVFLWIFKVFHGTFGVFQALNFVFVFLALLVPTTLFGFLLPFSAELYAPGCASPGGVGNIYAANTLGAVAGAVSAGFVFIPLLGLHLPVLALAALSAVFAFSMLAKAPEARLKSAAMSAFAVLFTVSFIMAVPGWSKEGFTSGVYQYAPDMLEESRLRSEKLGATLKRMLGGAELVYYKEGLHSTVAVKKDKGSGTLSLSIDGKVDASSSFNGDMQTQTLSAHLPMLLKPGARKVLVIGLASGVTLGALTRYPVEEIDCVEIEPAMRAASAYFAEWNNKALEDPRVKLIFNDGRNYLLTTRKKYDLIVSVPSNPWISSSSPLFSEEYFSLVRGHLNPGGTFCQWMQIYEVSIENHKTLIRTLQKEFPHVSLWASYGGDTLVLSGLERLRLDAAVVEAAIKQPGLSTELARVGVRSFWDLATRFIMADEALAAFAAGGALNRDDRPFIEFAAPKTIYDKDAGAANYQLLYSSMRTVSPYLAAAPRGLQLASEYLRRGLAYSAQDELASRPAGVDRALYEYLGAEVNFKKQDLRAAVEGYERALAARPGYLDALSGLSQAYYEMKDYGKAGDYAKKCLRVDQCSAVAYNRLGQIAVQGRRFEEAARDFEKARKCDPAFIEAYTNLAVLFVDYMSLPPLALEVLGEALKREPGSAKVHYQMGRALYRMGFTDQAMGSFGAAVSLAPQYEREIYAFISGGRARN